MISMDEYAAITGEEPPEAFDSCLKLAEEHIHLATFYAYTCDVLQLPRVVLERLKAAIAYQVQYVHLCGGVAGAQSQSANSASLGSFSYSEGASDGMASAQSVATAPAAKTFLPFLIAYARGMSQ